METSEIGGAGSTMMDLGQRIQDLPWSRTGMPMEVQSGISRHRELSVLRSRLESLRFANSASTDVSESKSMPGWSPCSSGFRPRNGGRVLRQRGNQLQGGLCPYAGRGG